MKNRLNNKDGGGSNDDGAWWRADPGYRIGATWFLMGWARGWNPAPACGPALVDDFGSLVPVNFFDDDLFNVDHSI